MIWDMVLEIFPTVSRFEGTTRPKDWIRNPGDGPFEKRIVYAEIVC